MGTNTDDVVSLRSGERRRAADAIEEEILAAIRGVAYGSVEVVIHEGQVVQIERKERRRFVKDPA